MLRLSHATCDVGDHFPVPKSAGTTMFWTYLPTVTHPITCHEPMTLDWPPRWSFNRARWTSDSGPFVIDVFVRRS